MRIDGTTGGGAGGISGGPRPAAPDPRALADALGVTMDELQATRARGGAALAELARARGVSAETLRAVLAPAPPPAQAAAAAPAPPRPGAIPAPSDPGFGDLVERIRAAGEGPDAPTSEQIARTLVRITGAPAYTGRSAGLDLRA